MNTFEREEILTTDRNQFPDDDEFGHRLLEDLQQLDTFEEFTPARRKTDLKETDHYFLNHSTASGIRQGNFILSSCDVRLRSENGVSIRC